MPSSSTRDDGGQIDGIKYVLLGAGKAGNEDGSLISSGCFFIDECGIPVFGEGWGRIFDGSVAAHGLTVTEYARARKGEGSDLHSLLWERPKSRESFHVLCLVKTLNRGVIQEVPLVGRIQRFVRLSIAGSDLEVLRAAEVELFNPIPTYDQNPPSISSSMFRIATVGGGRVRLVPLPLIARKLCRCGSGSDQHFLKYTTSQGEEV